MSKKLFIFRPHKDWNYCGGVLVFCADTFERCQELINEYIKSQEYETNYTLLYYDIKLSFETDHWVLERVYHLSFDYREQIVLNNWNDA